MSFAAVMPVVYQPYLHAALEGMHPDFAQHVTIVEGWHDLNDRHVNLGVAASWNVAVRRCLDDQLDYALMLSSSIRFGPLGGRDITETLNTSTGAWVVEPSLPLGWHAIAFARPLLEWIGYLDEHFWPIYGEDADLAYKCGIGIEEHRAHDHVPWVVPDYDAWITGQNMSTKLTGVDPNMETSWRYYETKWGGRSGKETFRRPYNDPQNPLGFWAGCDRPLRHEHPSARLTNAAVFL